MAADLADRSFSLLPSVFELLLHNADNIIDDTSIEKLLTWLGEVSSQRNSLEALLSGETGAREFLHSDKLFESSTSLAFALRLCGLLWRHEECFEDLESMLGLFKKSTLDSNGLWGEAVVRHAWFSGLQSLCTHRAGRKALQHLSECFSKAAEHVTDSSMFVAQAARTFTAKLLISSFVDDSISTNNLASVLPNTASLLKTLKAKLSVEPMTSNTGNPNYGIAALELIRILLDTNAKAGQDVLRFSGLFTATIKLLYVSDGTYCSKFVDIICEMVSSTSPWGLEWDRLLTVCHEEEGAGNTSLMLLQLPLVLMERQFTSLAVALISGLAFPEGTLPSSFPSTWYQCLYAVLDAVLAALYPPPPSGTDTICNGSVGTTRRCHDIVKEIISLCEKENGVDKVVKGEIRQLLCPGRMSEKSKLNVLIKVIGAVEGLASKAPQACPVSTSKWSKYSLAVLANCALGDVPNEEYVLPPGLQGDLKLLKASLSAALSLIKVQVMVQGNDGDEILYEAAKLLVKIVKNSESEAMVIVAALKALGELLNVSSSTTESLLATTPQTTGAPALKHPELCDRNSCLTTGSPTRKRHGPCDQGNEIEGATTRSEPKAQASDKNSDSPDMKRPKKCTEQGNLVSSKPTVSPTIGDNVLHAQAPNTSTDSPPGSSGSIVASGESFSCELGMALHQSLRDQMWEIKDSVLELVLSLLQTQQGFEITGFLCILMVRILPWVFKLTGSQSVVTTKHNLPCAIWRAVDDCESYVRASAWLVIGHIICCASLHIYNCQGSLITEVNIYL
ncbi:predicted protein [Nematostella vectensis]|uniref:Uncharacterized protein n=1 Tax=Nematostella vectensis TaxID=45351 RepID=A7SS66_NEMVE|nr:predicted protein [Nematostella vectensis]|eukprot:XP_001625577.1 predicted protein [Nematostella vectensis]